MKSCKDLSLYLVTNRRRMTDDEFFRIIQKSVNGGVQIVQLREKEISARQFISLGKQLMAMLKPQKIPLIINDRVDVAHAICADGVHMGQSDLSVCEARAILGEHAIIGLSVETIEQAIMASCENIDYLAASPVFDTQTKSDCQRPWGLEGLKHLCSISSYPVIAIGGITEENVEEVLNAGAQGVAVISAIFHAPCPQRAASNLLKRIKKYAVSRLG